MTAGINSSGMTNVERVCAAWIDPPEWVMMLARECDKASQKRVGERLGRSGGYISRILAGLYTGSLAEAELLVRSRFSADRVDCPLFGDMPVQRCVRMRRKTGSPVNRIESQCARACPTCPINTDKGVRQ